MSFEQLSKNCDATIASLSDGSSFSNSVNKSIVDCLNKGGDTVTPNATDRAAATKCLPDIKIDISPCGGATREPIIIREKPCGGATREPIVIREKPCGGVTSEPIVIREKPCGEPIRIPHTRPTEWPGTPPIFEPIKLPTGCEPKGGPIDIGIKIPKDWPGTPPIFKPTEWPRVGCPVEPPEPVCKPHNEPGTIGRGGGGAHGRPEGGEPHTRKPEHTPTPRDGGGCPVEPQPPERKPDRPHPPEPKPEPRPGRDSGGCPVEPPIDITIEQPGRRPIKIRIGEEPGTGCPVPKETGCPDLPSFDWPNFKLPKFDLPELRWPNFKKPESGCPVEPLEPPTKFDPYEELIRLIGKSCPADQPQWDPYKELERMLPKCPDDRPDWDPYAELLRQMKNGGCYGDAPVNPSQRNRPHTEPLTIPEDFYPKYDRDVPLTIPQDKKETNNWKDMLIQYDSATSFDAV